MKQITMQLAQYRSISQWEPQVGDLIIQHGWFTHWFGIVNGINGGVLTITKAGLPVLLVSMDEAEITKQSIQVGLSKVVRSKGGKYAILQNVGNNITWYV